MRIGISGLAAGNPGGLGRLCRTCILALAQARPDWQLHVYLRDPAHIQRLREECDKAHAHLVDGITAHYPAFPLTNRLYLEEVQLPRQFKPLNLDGYLGTDFTLPRVKLAQREAVVVPDLLPFTRPRTVGGRARWLYRRGLRRAMQREAELLCISERTRQAVAEHFPGAARTTVIHPALSPRLAWLAEGAAITDHAVQVRGTKAIVADLGRFLLYVGDFGMRKNVDSLVSVFRSIVENGDYYGSLVLAGGDGRYNTAPQRPQLALEVVGAATEQERDGPQVYDLGYVSDADLSQLYAAADLLVNLSVEEGYGYPVLEALAHGTPAVVTRGSAMEEIAPGGIVATELVPEVVARTLTSALAALPVLRQEVAALPRGWFSIDRLGEELARAMEGIHT